MAGFGRANAGLPERLGHPLNLLSWIHTTLRAATGIRHEFDTH